MPRILGIDPGSRITGYGIVDVEGRTRTLVACGPLKVLDDGMPARLKNIFVGVTELCERYSPDAVAIEEVFMSKNAGSALKLGQARGAAICAAVARDLPVHEYAASEVKQAVAGSGRADKTQVQQMVRHILDLNDSLQADAADALAIALTHSYTDGTLSRYPELAGARSGRWR